MNLHSKPILFLYVVCAQVTHIHHIFYVVKEYKTPCQPLSVIFAVQKQSVMLLDRPAQYIETSQIYIYRNGLGEQGC